MNQEAEQGENEQRFLVYYSDIATLNEDSVPEFIGQDFINPPLIISGLSAFITIEPNPDNRAAPFSLKVSQDKVFEEIDVNRPAENVSGSSLPYGKTSLSFIEKE